METTTVYVKTTDILNTNNKLIRFYTTEKTICEGTYNNWHLDTENIEMLNEVLNSLWPTDQKIELIFDNIRIYQEYLREEESVLQAASCLFRENNKLMSKWMEYSQAYILIKTNTFIYRYEKE